MEAKTLYPVGLDLGGTRTRCVITCLEKGRIRFLGAGEVESHGWLRGKIADQRAVADAALAALREAERCAQVSVEAAVVGVAGPTVRGANARGVVELGRPREIEQRDVNRAVHRASYVQLMDDRMLLQMFPQDFVVDDHPGHRDPRGMLASRLEANVHLITASTLEHNSVVGAVNMAHLLVEETVFDPLAACFAAVMPEDRRKEGVALLDIGAQSSDMVVYYGDALHASCSLPICGDHFTRDLALTFHISPDDAELIKRQFGSAVAAATSESTVVVLPAPENRDEREASRRLISQILEARAQELLKYVMRELTRVGMDRLLSAFVLTGGGACLPGLCDMAEAFLPCEARIGLPVGIASWPAELDHPGWTVAAGLAMYSGRLKVQSELEKQSTGIWGRILSR